jgi:hypothetical protein
MAASCKYGNGVSGSIKIYSSLSRKATASFSLRALLLGVGIWNVF